jgi:hypothetical protein
MDERATLRQYLRQTREDLVGKLDGLGEYDVRRPLTPTGTNLLGLVKHCAFTELGYFTLVFGLDPGRDLFGNADDPDADMWAAPDESREEILEQSADAGRRADETLDALDLDAPGAVPWWPPERRAVTLHQIAVHTLVDMARHAGHADILRESLDRSAGRRPGDPSVPDRTDDEWVAYRARLESAALAWKTT